jgi:hypothetical protein
MKLIDITHIDQLRTGVPQRFTYRGFMVRRTRAGREGVCFWHAARPGAELVGTLPTQMIEKIDGHLQKQSN